MNFIPKRSKYNKTFMLLNKKNKKVNFLNFGNLGLKVINNFILEEKHLKLIHKFLSKKLKKIGKFWIKSFPNFTVTKKALETRMGGGKGKCETWGIFLSTGSIFLEIYTNSFDKSYLILSELKKKLPKKLKIVNHFL